MLKYLTILSSLLFVNCCLATEMASQSMKWIKSALPDSTSVTYEKYKFGYAGFKHKAYNLNFTHRFSENIVVEAGLSRLTDKLHIGSFTQSFKLEQLSFVPRYIFASGMSFGGGLTIQNEADFRGAFGQDFAIPKGQTFMLDARLPNLQNNQYWQFSVESYRWEKQANSGTWFTRGKADTRVNVQYKAYF